VKYSQSIFLTLENGIMTKNNLAILQARMSSTRLPGKVLADINGRPMIYWQIMRIREAKSIDELVVVTSTDQSDNVLTEYLQQQGVLVERGSIDNVLERFLQTLERFKEYENIVRLTADCPLVMPKLIDEMVTKFEKSNIDFLSNALEPTFPDGLDVEIVKQSALIRLSGYPLSTAEREHVTLGLRNRINEFSVENFSQDTDLSSLRWTVDYEEDLEFARKVYDEFNGNELTFNYQDLLDLLRGKPKLINRISGNLRNVALNEIQE
jgi:spore coat polysaccharide biosynthesis protein SpsF